MKRLRFLIIGAGPTGLGAAHRLLELTEDFVVLEAARSAGGLASSIVDDAGFTWDLGSHLQHSHYAKFDQYMDLALGPDEWIEHRRSAWAWLCDRYVPYPFQLNLRHLPNREKWRCVKGLIAAQQDGDAKVENFEQWILATFGEGINGTFMRPYNEKVWVWPLSELSHHWFSDRVAIPKLEEVLRGICLEQDQTNWGPNATFRYPRRGGTGVIWQRLAEQLPANMVHYGRSVVSIDRNAHVVSCQAGDQYRYEHLISTAPVDWLARICNPQEDLTDATRLKHTSTHVVGLGVKGVLPDDLQGRFWGYYCQDWLPFYRLTVMCNLSPENTPSPENTWSIMAEVARRDGAGNECDLVDEVVQGLGRIGLLRDAQSIVSKWHQRLEHGYPVPTLERDRILANVLPRLQRDSIFSRGRFGAWKYEVSNQDHSFMQGVEAVDHILFGHPEVTLENPDLVNRQTSSSPIGMLAR